MRRHQSKRYRVVGLGCLLALGLAACTSGNTDSPPTTTTTSVTKGPSDRDPAAVSAALRRIDFCALLESAMAATPEYPTQELDAGQPFSCYLGSVVRGLDVWPLSSFDRQSLTTLELGGAKAYRGDTHLCEYFLPVSFKLTLNFRLSKVGTAAEACGPADNLVAAAVATLADPSAVELDQGPTACDIMSAAFEADADRYKQHLGDLHRCSAWDTKVSDTVTFQFHYGTKLHRDSERTTETIVVTDGYCFVEWRIGPARFSYAAEPDLMASTIAQDCATVKRIAESAMAVLANPPQDAAPQRPLLYAPNEPDTP